MRTKAQRAAYNAVRETAICGLYYMPSTIGERSACAALCRQGVLVVEFARHEETGNEGIAYGLSLRPLFNMVVGSFLRQQNFFAARIAAHYWKQRAEYCHRPQLWDEGKEHLALLHARLANWYREKKEEDMVLVHALTVEALCK